MTGSLGLFGKKQKSLVGVDISSSGVKLAEMRYVNGRYELMTVGREDLPPGLMNDRQVAEPEAVGKIIARLLKRANVSTRDAAIAVSGSPVITKTIALPNHLSERDMEEQIRLEADQYVPYPIEEVNLDFTVLGPSPHGDGSVTVLLAACRSEAVDERLAAIESAGLKAQIVDIEDYALDNAILNFALDPEQGQVVLVCDIGASHTIMSIFDGGKPVYRREQSFGGRQLTEDVMRHYGMPADEADAAKRSGKLPEDYSTEVLPYFIDDLAQQVDRALQLFFANSTQYSSIDKILFAGGSASAPGLPEAIQDKLGVHCELINPLAHIAAAPGLRQSVARAEAPALLVAMGLAMRSMDL
ncbi:MAG: type IV pilus assembly protein PilM [Oceanococcaceae bacterium]